MHIYHKILEISLENICDEIASQKMNSCNKIDYKIHTCGHADDHEEGADLVHHFIYILCDVSFIL
jgi:hypothetical protein